MEFKVSVVVPVYLGEQTLDELTKQVLPLTKGTVTQGGRSFIVNEIIFVHDCGPDNSAEVIERICREQTCVKAVWLSRNFGQHAATTAGMAATRSEWVVTMDEDLQHDPNEIGNLLDRAIDAKADIVYGKDNKTKVHGIKRSLASRFAKITVGLLVGNTAPRDYSSFRFISGPIARGVSAYMGEGVYLDVALGWITERVRTCDVTNRFEYRNNSGYTFKKLFGHLLRLVLSNGTRPLRIVTISGVSIASFGLVYACFVVAELILFGEPVRGWASLMVALTVIGGLVLISLGVIAEYFGLAVRAALGKPSYFVLQNKRSNSEQPESSD
jgi:undecaprenyl-phosphate 4-deoxy-4-formamido-L-arabinose transferase